MSTRDLIQEALHSLESNKGRSLLTILGIVIGIASVIAMTSLIGGERVFKTDERVEAYGSVDELTAFVALLTDHLRGDVGLEPRVWELARIASQLMTVAATLAVGEGGADKVKGIDAEAVKFLEEAIDRMQASVKPITKFTIPGGHRVVSLCHVCRTVCRRAERAALRADAKYGVAPEVLMYLNRLSDYFYLLGRTLTEYFSVEETLWIP